MSVLRYFNAYPAATQAQVRELIENDRLDAYLQRRYPERHEIRSDKALYEYAIELKQQYLRSSASLHKVVYQNKMDVLRNVLGLHTTISRVQGGKLKSKQEIRIASLFKEAPPEFLEMVVVHELAHLKESDHNKAFYQLCCYMLPDYHQIEFDLRLYLAQRELVADKQLL
jgi:predicted metal-dependent hydrolase